MAAEIKYKLNVRDCVSLAGTKKAKHKNPRIYPGHVMLQNAATRCFHASLFAGNCNPATVPIKEKVACEMAQRHFPIPIGVLQACLRYRYGVLTLAVRR